MGRPAAAANYAEVTSMRDFLHGMLEEATRIDGLVHDAILRLRERIYALELAEDPDFLAEHREFSEQAKAGEVGPGLTAEEFAKRYLNP
jgi:hypothetical protein